MKKQLSMALAAALFALPLAASAQDEGEDESRLSWNLALTSNYMFRGVDLNDDKPALQAGLDFAFDNGIYAGIWGSNVDFDVSGGPDMELDVFVGWSRDLNDDWNVDLMATRYTYHGARDSYGSANYNEFYANLSYQGALTFTLAYTNDYGNAGDNGWYYGLAANHAFDNGWSIDSNLGWSTFGNDLGLRDYMDWSLGVSRDFGPINASLRYHGTDNRGRDNFGRDAAEDKLVLTFKIEG